MKMKENKKQYEFNRSVESHLEDITVAKTLLNARNSAEEVLCFVKGRNKLIKIADQHGWDMVNRYVSDPLAEDEADSKCLRKAVKDAERARDKMKSDKVVLCQGKGFRVHHHAYAAMSRCQPLCLCTESTSEVGGSR